MITYSLTYGIPKTSYYFPPYLENKVDIIFNSIEGATAEWRLELKIPEIPVQMCPIP